MKHFFVAGLVTFLMGAGSADAATLTATWNIGGAGGNSFGNRLLDPGNVGEAFTIEFDDLNANSLLDTGEVTSFSGLSYLSGGGTISRNEVRHWLDITGVAVGTGALGFTGWFFVDSTTGSNSTFFNDTFAYDVNFGQTDPDPIEPIPLPASVWLMIAALGGLGLIRRRDAV